MKQSLPLKYVFLICLILIVQANMVIKVVGLSLLLIAWNGPIASFRLDRMAYFYITMLLMGLFSLGYVASEGPKYLMVVLLGSIFWIICLIMHLYAMRVAATQDTEWLFRMFFRVNWTMSFVQILYMAIEHGGNPFLDMGAGDNVRGIFANSSVNMIVMSFFLVYFLYRRQILSVTLAGLAVLSTTYMSGIVIFFAAAGCVSLLHPGIRLKAKVVIGALGILLISALILASPGNITYSKYWLSKIAADDAPRKIISFRHTADFLVKSPENFFIGAGIGNFSSRLAFSAGGEYASWYPSSWRYKSKNFEKYHFTLWNEEVLSVPYNDGTANQPFSVYNQLAGEYGFIGLLLFLVLYVSYLWKNLIIQSYGLPLFLLLLGYFLLDYWFEFFSVVIIFELMILSDIVARKRHSESHRY